MSACVEQKLDFLQWYHHITVLLFCWHSYANTSSTGLYFVAMNYSVHAIMYGYFYLKQIDAWPKWVPAQFITVAQIAQMVVGTTVSYFSYVYLKDGIECDVKPENVIAGGLMYGSYLYLFSKVSQLDTPVPRCMIWDQGLTRLCLVLRVTVLRGQVHPEQEGQGQGQQDGIRRRRCVQGQKHQDRLRTAMTHGSRPPSSYNR